MYVFNEFSGFLHGCKQKHPLFLPPNFVRLSFYAKNKRTPCIKNTIWMPLIFRTTGYFTQKVMMCLVKNCSYVLTNLMLYIVVCTIISNITNLSQFQKIYREQYSYTSQHKTYSCFSNSTNNNNEKRSLILDHFVNLLLH